MKVTPTAIAGVLILEPKVFGDERGFFMESFNQKEFNAAVGHEVTFVQDNHSRSAKGVLRGLHYQHAPHAQGKLVHVTQGSVFDVAVDIRPGSATYGKWVGAELSGQNHRQMWIPPGLAHGFLVTSDSADFIYKTTDYYAQHAEACILWSDLALVGGGLKMTQVGRFEFVDGSALLVPGMTSEAERTLARIRVEEIRPRLGPLIGSSCPR